MYDVMDLKQYKKDLEAYRQDVLPGEVKKDIIDKSEKGIEANVCRLLAYEYMAEKGIDKDIVIILNGPTEKNKSIGFTKRLGERANDFITDEDMDIEAPEAPERESMGEVLEISSEEFTLCSSQQMPLSDALDIIEYIDKNKESRIKEVKESLMTCDLDSFIEVTDHFYQSYLNDKWFDSKCIVKAYKSIDSDLSICQIKEEGQDFFYVFENPVEMMVNMKIETIYEITENIEAIKDLRYSFYDVYEDGYLLEDCLETTLEGVVKHLEQEGIVEEQPTKGGPEL